MADLEKEKDSGHSLDGTTLRKMLLAFEKKLSANQQLRLKYPDQPEKFMDSEVGLDEEIKKLSAIGSAPHLYSELISLNCLPSILSLLNHENTDINVDVIELLQELTDPGNYGDMSENEHFVSLVDALIENGFLPLLIEALPRLCPALLSPTGSKSTDSEENRQGLYHAFEILENLLEFKPSLSSALGETPIFSYLLKLIGGSEFDDAQLYSVEILAILLQGNTENQRKFAKLDGVDPLLTALAKFKKREPKNLEEEEWIENLFDCLCSALLVPENQTLFLKAEGIELMLIMIKEKGFCRKSGLKVLDYALLRNPANCAHFVTAQGLKTVFAAFLQKGKVKNKKGVSEADDDEHIVSILAQLFERLTGESFARLLNKFKENDFEKVDRLVELHEKYFLKVEKVNQIIGKKRKRVEEEGEEIDSADEEEFYLEKLDAGFFTLQLIDLLVAFVLVNGGDEIRKHLLMLLNQKDISFDELKATLRDYAANMGSALSEKDREKERNMILDLANNLF